MPGYDDETKRLGGWDANEPPPRELRRSRGPSNIPYVNAARLWSGGVATAVVAALIGIVGVLVVRAVFQISVLSPKSAGAFGDYTTYVLCGSGALAALIATGLAHLLLLGAPRPLAYLGWIVGLLTAIATVWPFLGGGGPILVTVATAIIHLIMGLVILSLVTGAAASASRPPPPPAYDPRYDR